MVVLGLLLLAASVGAAVSIAVSNTDSMSFEVFGWTVTTLSAGGLMLLGIALGVTLLIGLWLLTAGLRRSRHRRSDSRNAVEQERSRIDKLQEENDRLRAAAGRRTSSVESPRTDAGYDDKTSDAGGGHTTVDVDRGQLYSGHRAPVGNDAAAHEAASSDAASPDTASRDRESHGDKRVFGRGNI